MKKRSIGQSMYWGFWLALKKIGVWESCPNCDSAWNGGRTNPETIKRCIICGHDKKIDAPNQWVWGWVEPRFISRWILNHRNKNLNNYPDSDYGDR